MNKQQKVFRKRIGVSLVFVIGFIAVFSMFPITRVAAQTAAENQTSITPERAEVLKWALMAAAVAFGFGALGAGFAISHVGAAAMGAIGEKPEIASQALIFIALAEGLVVFGFITALLILGKV